LNQSKYFAPKSIKEAVSLLSEYTDKSKIIAGGTDLLTQMKSRVVLPDFLISIGGICDLDYINYDEVDGLRVGALTAIASIESSSIIQSKFGILAQAASMLGTPVIRSRATIGGNLCNAAPSADIAPALMVLGARVKIAGVDGEEVIPIEGFFTGPGQTIVKHDQVLTEIQIPNLPLQSGGTYLKQTRRQGADLAVVGVAALVTMEGAILKDVKIALGAVAPTPIHAKKAEEILKGKKLDGKLLEESSQSASGESSPIDDTRSSADYRKRLVATLVKRAVRQAVEQVRMEV
jgi:carbon-monoxide dehydrogenase medium subunit